MSAAVVEIHTDGGASPNPGPGGWAAVLVWRDAQREISGFVPHTTNNQMELTAAIEALEALKRPSTVRLVTDSTYVRQGITSWIATWKRNGWRTAAKAPVANQELWQRLDRARTVHRVDWAWVKGHAGDPLNERADALVRQAIARGRAGKGAA